MTLSSEAIEHAKAAARRAVTEGACSPELAEQAMRILRNASERLDRESQQTRSASNREAAEAANGVGVETIDTTADTYTVVEAAARLGISDVTLYRLIRIGECPVRFLKLGRCVRIPKRAPEEYINAE